MSTSEPGRVQIAEALEPGAAAARSPIPLAELTDLANIFFRALPGQGVSTGIGQGAPAAVPSSAMGLSGFGPNVIGPSLAPIAPPPPVPVSAPSLAGATGFAPEIGVPVPGVPSLPVADKRPSESDLVRLAGEAGSPPSTGVTPPPPSTVPGIPGAQVLSLSPLSATGMPGPVAGPEVGIAPLIRSADVSQGADRNLSHAVRSAATPPSIDLPAAGMPGVELSSVGSDWSGALLSGAGSSPFSLPLPQSLPEFDSRFLNPQGFDFDPALPGLPGLPR